MATEIELKLALTAAAAKSLPAHPLLATAPRRRRRLLNTYYDTPDLRLTAARVALRFRKIGANWLLTVKSAEPSAGGLAQRSEWETPAEPGVFSFGHVEAPALRQRLEAMKPDLAPIFTTDFLRTEWVVEFGCSTIELALDIGHVASGGRRQPLRELELELRSGDIGDLFGLATALQNDLVLHPSAISKAERGYALYAAEPPKPCKAAIPDIVAIDSAPMAFRRIALCCVEQLQRNEVGISSSDPEFIHQARVALRRLRSALKLFAPLLPPDFADTQDRAWREAARLLGECRNLEVFATQLLPELERAFSDAGEITRLQKRTEREIRRARRAVADYFASPQYARQLLGFTAALFSLPETPDGTHLDRFATERLERLHGKMSRLAEKAHLDDPEVLHRFRLRCKELRYSLEFFAPLLISGKRARRYLAHLTRLQDALGAFNDHVSALAWLGHARPKQPGLVDAWLTGRRDLLQAALPALISDWAARPFPWHGD